VARTEEVSWTEWKKQKFYQSNEKKAQNNLDLLEKLRENLKNRLKLVDFGASQKDLFAYSIDLNEVINDYLDKYILEKNDNIRIDVLKKICQIKDDQRQKCLADIVWMRIDTKESRTIKPDHSFNNIFQPYNDKYIGDSALCNARPKMIQIQIHYVKPMNEDMGKHYSPALAIYIPDNYAENIVGQKND
jgi:hypothetical protein